MRLSSIHKDDIKMNVCNNYSDIDKYDILYYSTIRSSADASYEEVAIWPTPVYT